MLIEKLQATVDSMARLSPQQQEELAERIKEALADIVDEAEWDVLIADPRSAAFLDELVAEAEQGPLLPFPAPRDMGDDDPADERQ